MIVVRNLSTVLFWYRPVARAMMRREARALLAAEKAGIEGIPRILAIEKNRLARTWIAGHPLQDSPPDQVAWFSAARRLLASLHQVGITHNDTAKEPNWIVTDSGLPSLIDFQLARASPTKGWVHRLLGREDLRHLYKHKRTYFPEHLNPRELALVENPSFAARFLRMTAKPVYNWMTRRLFNWSDAEGKKTLP